MNNFFFNKDKFEEKPGVVSKLFFLAEELKTGRDTGSRELETLKALSRFVKQLDSENILKDIIIEKAKKIAEEKSTNKKSAVDYVNTVFGSKNRLSKNDILFGLSKIEPAKSADISVENIKGHYNTMQRVHEDDKINTSAVAEFSKSPTEAIILKYRGKFPHEVKNLINATRVGHFGNDTGFVRFTKVDKNWIHIDAIQTDFFNKVRKLAKTSEKDKELKKMFSEILATEEPMYKSIINNIKRKNPSVKIWTMNTSEIAGEVEHISNYDKLFQFYEVFPKKLGFKKIPLEQLKKIVETRNITLPKSSFLHSISSSSENEKARKKLKEALDSLFSSWVHQHENDFISSSKAGPTIATIIQHLTTTLDDDAVANLMNDIIRDVAVVKTGTIVAYKKDVIDRVLLKHLPDDGNNTNSTYKTIWWGNREMINEGRIEFDNIIKTYLGETI